MKRTTHRRGSADSSDLKAARLLLKQHIKAFLDDNTIYNLLPTNGEVPVVDGENSILDLLDIWKSEDKNFCLVWSSEKQRIEGIHLAIDLLSLLLNLDLNHFITGKNRDDREQMFADIRKNVQKYFSEITLRRLRENLKSFKGTGGLAQPIVYSKVADTVFNGIQRLREAGVGHLVVTEKDSLATTVGVISKKDILVYMIKNFTTDTKIDVLLNEKVGKLEIGTLGNKVVCCSKNETLRRVLQEMARLKVSCIPITDENKIYQGAIVKGHVEMILREASLHLLEFKVSEFLELTKSSKQYEDYTSTVVYPSDSLRDVIQKFLLNKGQNMYLDTNDKLLGVISINDIINYLL